MIQSASNTNRRRRQVWLVRMRQLDACWVGEVTLKGSRIGTRPLWLNPIKLAYSPCRPDGQLC